MANPKNSYSCPKVSCPSYGLKQFSRHELEDHVHEHHGGPKGQSAETMDNWEGTLHSKAD